MHKKTETSNQQSDMSFIQVLCESSSPNKLLLGIRKGLIRYLLYDYSCECFEAIVRQSATYRLAFRCSSCLAAQASTPDGGQAQSTARRQRKVH
eukprot:2893392-Amphidinium_carterae.1